MAAGATWTGAAPASSLDDPRRAAPSRGRATVSDWTPAAVGALAGVLLFVAVHRALPDDAYITLSYARNLAEHGHWGLLADRTANTATSPLQVWLLAAGILVLPRPVVVDGLLLVVCLAVIGRQVDRLARASGASRAAGVLVPVVLASSPLIASTVGLEPLLGAAVLAALARHAHAGHGVVTGLLVGAAVLTRPDLTVPAVALAAGLLLAPRVRRRGARTAGALALGAAVALPWHLWSWRYLGGFVPDTTWFKTLAGASISMLTAPVRFYGDSLPAATALSAVPVAAGAIAVVAVVWRPGRRTRPVCAVVAAGWAHVAAMAAIGAYPQAWYYAPLVGCSLIGAALSLPAGARRTVSAASAGVVLLAAAGAVLAGPLPWRSAPLATNLADTADYQRIAADLPALTAGAPDVAGPGEIGVLAYSSAVPVVDLFSDRGDAHGYLDARAEQAGPALRTALRWNWRYRPDPPAAHPRYGLAFSWLPVPAGRVVASWPVSSPQRAGRVVLVDTAP